MIGVVLGVVAALVQLAGYAIYVQKIRTSRPNTASWLIWVYGSGLEAVSYVVMSRDWVKSLLPVACSMACMATFFAILGRGKFGRISGWEWICVGFDVSAIFVWWRWQSATWAHLVMQAGVPLSFAPLFVAVWRQPKQESPLPWAVWSLAYALGLAAVILRWDKWPEVVYALNYLICTSGVWAVSGLKRETPESN